MAQVVLTSSEGTEFTIDRDIADKSMLLKCMLDDIGEIGQGTQHGFCLADTKTRDWTLYTRATLLDLDMDDMAINHSC